MSSQGPPGIQRGGAPLAREHLRMLRDLLAVIDTDVTGHYAEHGAEQLRPRFTPAMIALGRTGAMTVRQLADHLDLTHSAASQSVSALRAQHLITSTAGTDARTQVITLTGRGRELVPFLEDQRAAGEQAWAQLDAELVYPLEAVVADLAAALARRSFLQRLRDHHPAPAGHDRTLTGGPPTV